MEGDGGLDGGGSWMRGGMEGWMAGCMEGWMEAALDGGIGGWRQ